MAQAKYYLQFDTIVKENQWHQRENVYVDKLYVIYTLISEKCVTKKTFF